MHFIKIANLFANMPNHLSEEWFEVLAQTGKMRIERIVSQGHVSPPGFWYDQPWDELVVLLRGGARLLLREDRRQLHLAPGDFCILPAHCQHRVTWTVPNCQTVWLAIHYAPENGGSAGNHDT